MALHPDDEALLKFCEASSRGQTLPAIDRHLRAGCRRCDTRIEAIRAFISSLRGPALSAPPARWVADAQRRLDELEPAGSATKQAARHRLRRIAEPAAAGAGRILREVRLRLVLDSAAGPLLAGIRGSVMGGYRQLLFVAPPASLHVQVKDAPRGRQDLLGQLTPLEKPAREGGLDRLSGRVTLEAKDSRVVRRLSPTGEFQFRAVRRGPVRLRVEWSGGRFVTDSFKLPERSDD